MFSAQDLRDTSLDITKVQSMKVGRCAREQCLVMQLAGQVVGKPGTGIKSVRVVTDESDFYSLTLSSPKGRGVNGTYCFDRCDSGHAGTDNDIVHASPSANK